MVYRDDKSGFYVDIRAGGIVGRGSTAEEARQAADRMVADRAARAGQGRGPKTKRAARYVWNPKRGRYEIVI